ncbi:hypothetical protein FB474_2376 [Oryzihumus leptocrescens]|uniref:Uncharacterized protein n=2 Tax=Oryzihumus leptocrescens TaxID=297536 RepID=A0A542ZKU2_9MICO|nr:hypothetical protein FB474_2376 [Oryzihumus leptocrescens]
MFARIGTAGRWRVRTETAVYDIDLDAAWICRHPANEQRGGAHDARVAALRLDDTPIPLVTVHQCQLGAPMILVLDLRGDGILTVRLSTEVLTIERAR